MQQVIQDILSSSYKNYNTQAPAQSAAATMVFPILGIIIACLSLPLVIYAGERTIRRTITRPQLFRSVSAPQKPSERLVGKMAEGRPATPRRKTTSSLGEEGPVRADTNASEASWLSTSTAETYVRGMSLEKVGLD